MDRFRHYLTTAFLLFAAPLPLVVCLAFKMGGWVQTLESAGGVLLLAALYWLPIGVWLAFSSARFWKRLLIGYLISLPLYFLTLTVLYPLWGGVHFHPLVSGSRLRIYLSATPTFYGLVRLTFFLSTCRIGIWTRRAAAAAALAGISAPLFFTAASGMSWPSPTTHVAITGARIVDASSNRIVDGQDVFVENGRIVAIVAIGASVLHPGWPRIDARGRYLLPGLIDVHTHLQSPVELSAGFNFTYFAKSMMGGYAPQRSEYLASGITSVRDLGGSAAVNYRLRADILAKKTLGPRFFTSGRLVTSPHGHPVSTIWPDEISREGAILATDEPGLIAALDRNYAEGPPDAVKIVHGTIGRAKEELSPELMAAAIRWADRHHLISIVHAETAAEDEDALRAGATGIEHAAYLQDVPEALAALVAERHPFVDPTFGEVATDRDMLHLSPAEKSRRMQLSYQAVRKLQSTGARLAIGTDAPMVRFGAGLHDELDEFTHAGFCASDILSFATVNNAAYLGKASELGRIAPGYRADLILTDANPLEHLATLRHPVWTMLDGQIVFRRP